MAATRNDWKRRLVLLLLYMLGTAFLMLYAEEAVVNLGAEFGLNAEETFLVGFLLSTLLILLIAGKDGLWGMLGKS